MPERRAYYISLDKQTISDVSVPDTTEYEVWVNSDEFKAFRALLNDSDKQDFWFAVRSVVVKPFDEKEIDEMRKEDYDNLMKVYQFLYKYGTEKTREKLAEVGFDRR